MRRPATFVLLAVTTSFAVACTPAAPPAPTAAPPSAANPTVAAPVQAAPPTAPAAAAPAAAKPTDAPKPAAAAAPAAGGKDTLVIAQSVDPPKLDPFSTTAPYISVFAQIVEPLVYWEVDASGKPTMKNWLTTDWKWVDSTTLQYKLRTGVTFSNGEPFDATSAKLSLERLFAAPDYSQWLKDLLKEVTVVDPSTVSISLSKPAGYVPSVIALGSFVVPPKDFQARGADTFNQAPVGTGPWVYKDRVKDASITLTANPNYWYGTPKFKTITYRIIPDDTARVAAVEAGEVDIATLLPLTAAQRLEANANLQVKSVNGLRQFLTMFDTRAPAGAPMKDVRVRQALNLAVDKAALCKSLFQGRCTPLPGQWLASHQTGSNTALQAIPYDPAKAKQLLADSGYRDGFPVDMTYTVGRYPQDKQAGEAVSNYLRQVGIKVTERGVDFPEFARQFDNNQPTAMFQWGVLFSQDGYLAMLPFVKGSRFRTSEMPAAFDEIMDKAAVTADEAARMKLLQDANATLNEQPFGLYLYTLDDIYATSKAITGFNPRPDQTLRLTSMGVTPK